MRGVNTFRQTECNNMITVQQDIEDCLAPSLEGGEKLEGSDTGGSESLEEGVWGSMGDTTVGGRSTGG